jgi:hypothetical protein
VEEGIVRTDARSAGVLVTPLGQQVCWQMGENMLFDVPAVSSRLEGTFSSTSIKNL